MAGKPREKANPVWGVILGLSRYGGLRTPSETLSLRWEDIDWEMNRVSIPEPKVEHHEGQGIRSCLIFRELRPILDEAFEIFGDRICSMKTGCLCRLGNLDIFKGLRWVLLWQLASTNISFAETSAANGSGDHSYTQYG